MTQSNSHYSWRFTFVTGCLYLGLVAVGLRLAYWQVLIGPALARQALKQYQSSNIDRIPRGEILFSDGNLLVGNQVAYRLVGYPNQLESDPKSITERLLPLIIDEFNDYQVASTSSEKKAVQDKIESTLESRLAAADKKWVLLKNGIHQDTAEKIKDLELASVGLEPYYIRYYPEASLAAHVVGFVGQNEQGEATGYFGLEGALNRELEGKSTVRQYLTDALGLQFFFSTPNLPSHNQVQVTTTLRRDIQFTVEELLNQAVVKYGAKSGEVIVMNPKSGEIYALAATPSYEPEKFYNFDPEVYKNPTLSTLFEPGSIFKPLTVAAGIDSGLITPETTCPRCAGPVSIGQYQIKTWNDKYQPDINMTEALAQSDNTAMVFIAQELGADQLQKYISAFKIGQPLDIDLEEDSTTPFPENWGDIQLATISFGQGIVTNSLQMVRAIGAIANQGQMMQPRIISSVTLAQDQTVASNPILLAQVIKPETAQAVTKMMITAAEEGEASWVASQLYTIAAKTGTAQVAEGGKYAADKTIASYIGFAPAQDPQFVMLVKLVEPQTSPWAAETAASLWYQIASKLFIYLQIPPDKPQNNPSPRL